MQTLPLAVVGEAIRVRPHGYTTEQPFVRAAENAEARDRTVTRDEQVVVRVDQDAGNTGQLAKRAHEHAGVAVEDVDAIGAGMGDEHLPARTVDIGMVEPGSSAAGNVNGASSDETHVRGHQPGRRTCPDAEHLMSQEFSNRGFTVS